MKKFALISTLGGVALLLCSCGTPIPPGAERGPDGTMAYDVLVESSPPGARIEANGESIGNAPIHLKIYGDPDGTFHDFGSPYYVVRAYPTGTLTNEFPQGRWYGTGHLGGPEAHIPQRIFFDMTQPPPSYPAYGSAPYAYPPPAYYGPPVYYGPPPPYWYGPSFRFYVGPGYHGYYHHW